VPAGAPSGLWREALGHPDASVTDGRLRLTLPALGGQVLLAGR